MHFTEQIKSSRVPGDCSTTESVYTCGSCWACKSHTYIHLQQRNLTGVGFTVLPVSNFLEEYTTYSDLNNATHPRGYRQGLLCTVEAVLHVDENMLCVVPDKLPPHQREGLKFIHSHERLYLQSVWHMDYALYLFAENGSLSMCRKVHSLEFGA